MKQSGSVRIILLTTLVAASIMAAKTFVPAIPLGTTVVAAALGLALIFSLFRSDARTRRGIAVEQQQASAPDARQMDSDAIRRRLEGRPVPQVSPGPLTRDMSATAATGSADGPIENDWPEAAPAASNDAPVLELVPVEVEEPAPAEEPAIHDETTGWSPAPTLDRDADWQTGPAHDDPNWDSVAHPAEPVMRQVAEAAEPPEELAEPVLDLTDVVEERASATALSETLDWSDFDDFGSPEPELGTQPEPAPSPEAAVAPGPLADAVPVPADAIASARANTIVLGEIFPPTSSPGLSFYGGLPVAPAGLAWPRAQTDTGEIPLTFVMQLECAKLAGQDATGLLPADGVLYLFMDLDWSRPMAYRFVHVPCPTGAWSQIEAPADLGPAYGSQAVWAWPFCAGADHDARGVIPRRLPQWAIEPARVDLAAGDGRFWTVGHELLGQLARIDGGGTAPAMPADFARPYPAFPHDWSAVRMACAYLLDLMRQDNQPAELARWLDETRMLYAVASREEPFEPIPQVSANEMWGWMEQVRTSLEPVFPAIVSAAINATLGARGAAAEAIPAEWIERAAAAHKLADRPAPNRLFGTPSWVQGHLRDFIESEVLLLEIGGNDTLGHFFGTGVLQFTIAPEDLTARNFDRVRMTVSAA
ncbi:DUF1963 domain-containing protein [Croceicoccus bisphenolivorans]|uniref:DUF1963 domain-containing protein n=1 Tax=Croceicoccus bisphenolivorans TaxID=1783232 RepID=UPI00082B7EDD|nr:DUF1963 domain-containing protein [Croceicoccus bisphenolivorans]